MGKLERDLRAARPVSVDRHGRLPERARRELAEILVAAGSSPEQAAGLVREAERTAAAQAAAESSSSRLTRARRRIVAVVSRRGTRLTGGAGVVIAALCLSATAATWSQAASDAAGAARRLDDPGITAIGPTTLAVDFSSPLAVTLLESSLTGTDVLDGLTIHATGLPVLTASERRGGDAAAGATVDPSDLDRSPTCPPEPAGPRATDGSTAAYLGCDPVSGPRWTQPFPGSPSGSIGAAVGAVIDQYIAREPHDIVTFEHSPGHIEVSLSTALGEHLAELGPDDASTLLTDLRFTVSSNGSIDRVDLTIDGDCLAFAHAVGGDMCGPLTFPTTAPTALPTGEAGR